jgi:NADP-dependent 3-hydroxy acid dehydrogenase YdfG
MPEINVQQLQEAIIKMASPGFHPERVFVFAGPLDLYAMIDIPAHCAAKVIVEGLLLQLRRDYGNGVAVKKVSPTRWEVDCSECKEEDE